MEEETVQPEVGATEAEETTETPEAPVESAPEVTEETHDEETTG